ncbi:MAG TPA: N-acetyltransferase [Firmicutes bacterium]|nr:N-acetyltransferase [Bacillota bacterium]
MTQYRKARIEDVEDIYQLIISHANEGTMLPRPRQSLYEDIREYIVAEEDGELIAVGALRILWKDLAEIRSLVVQSNHTRQNIGRKIVSLLEEEARALGLPRVFALTYQEAFFLQCGYHTISNKELPQKVWRDCIDCPKFPDCDEVAVLKNL